MAQSVKVSLSSPKLVFYKIFRLLGITLFCIFAVIIVLRPLLSPEGYDHYYYQALSWLNGKLDINNAPPELIDVVTYNGQRYLPLGVFPTVLTVPLVIIFGDNYRQAFLLYLVVAVSVWIGWRIVNKLKVVYPSSRIWLTALFFLSTVFFSCAIQPNGAWYVAHIVTVCFLLLAINESLGKRRAVLIGLYVGIAAATRFTALFSFPFFVWLLTIQDPIEPLTPREKIRLEPFKVIAIRYVLFGLGIGIPLFLYFLNNYLRFGSFLESGYNLATLAKKDSLSLARAEGLFSLAHLPKNLYYFLLAVPEPYNGSLVGNLADKPVLVFPFLRPSPWGMSLFITTPAVIYIFKATLRHPLVQACWVGIVVCAIPIITYYGVGWSQFGYRYALDFTPFIWLLIVFVLKEREISFNKPSLALWLIILGCIINLWGCYWMQDIRASI